MRARAESRWFKAQSIKNGKPGLRQIVTILLILLVILALGISIYYVSTTTFYAPVAQVQPFSAAPGAGDKGPLPSGDKGPAASGDKGGVPVGAQNFTLGPSLGYNFSVDEGTDLATAFDFPAGVYPSAMLVSYTPGLANMVSTNINFYVNRAFTLVPADNNAQLQTAFTVTLDYGKDLSSKVDVKNLMLYRWSGTEWQDAAGTCSPASSYDRAPDINRLSLAVCKMGTFILAVR